MHPAPLPSFMTSRALVLVSLLLMLAGCDQEPRSGKDAQAQPAAGIRLATGGSSDRVIVIPDNPPPPTRTAAQELSGYLTKITGAPFPVQEESSASRDAPAISVGATRRLAEAFPDLDLSKLKPDGIIQKTKGNDIFLAGQGTRGTLYAVFDFLENACGVRWWTPTEETVPKNPDLTVTAPDRIYEPAFSYRDANSRIFNDTVINHLKRRTDGRDERHRFAVRSKVNALVIGQIPPELGGNQVFISLEQDPKIPRPYHEYNHFINFREYGETHPEWFAERNGVRNTAALHTVQLCLSNEEMRAQFLENAKKWLDTLPDTMSFSILKNDNHNYCQCKECAALDEAEGSPMASYMDFMNFIAEGLEKHRPGVEIWMDAYTFTVKPPKTLKPRDNLGIILCTPIRSQRLSDDKTFLEQWEDWKRLTSKVRVWDYVVNYDNLVNPWPNLRHLGPNIQLMAANSAQGVFSQGNMWNSVGDAEELKTWLISHMLWDHSADPDALIKEFVTGYYGKAAQPVMAYLDLIVERGGDIRVGIPLHGGVAALDANAWLNLDAMNRATALLDEAGKLAADDPALEERIARLRMPLDNQWIWGWQQYRAEADKTGQPFGGPASPLEALAIFRKAVERFKATHDREQFGYGTMNRTLNRIETALSDIPGAPLPPPFENVPPENRVHLQEDRLTAIGGGARVVDDPLASNGKALTTPANHQDWNIQAEANFFRLMCRLGGLKGRWRVFMDVRVDAKKPSGNAMQAGIHSYEAPSMSTQKPIRIEDLAHGAYTRVELGIIDFDRDSERAAIWASPLKNPDTVNAIFVDRIFLVRE